MIYLAIKSLISYAVERHLIQQEDTVWAVNSLLELLHLTEYAPAQGTGPDSLEEILCVINDYAQEKGLITVPGVAGRDLFDTRVMGILTPRPSCVIDEFRKNYSVSPVTATDLYYKLSRDTDYIRTYRVVKDQKWTYDSAYGTIDITVNLSKPEKDPKAIAAAKLAPQSGYPKCLLCRENEGFCGDAARPARQNHRIIPLTLDGKQWYFQYSPYVYYNEHCIVLSSEHEPMQINRSTFAKMLDFISFLPHYFIGSNADLPIVGGSILSHDHMQGGKYSFAMQSARTETQLFFKDFEDVTAYTVKWPMSVIRLRCSDKHRLIDLAEKILNVWRGYSDPEAYVFAYTDGQPHNTITPIARMNADMFELDLVLRNNITTPEHPLGLFHPHEHLHNIKKENIGLIEVMGLAVLPARLKDEMARLTRAILSGEDIMSIPQICKHSAWFETFKNEYTFTPENTDTILRQQIGKTFVQVLECAGVYKQTPEGKAQLLRFADAVNNN